MDEEIAKHREEIEKAIQEWLDSVEATGYTAPPADVSAGGRTGRHCVTGPGGWYKGALPKKGT